MLPSDEIPVSGRSAKKFDAQFRTSKTTVLPPPVTVTVTPSDWFAVDVQLGLLPSALVVAVGGRLERCLV